MNLMVCFDGSTASHHALYFAKKRANLLGAKILVVTSMGSGHDIAADCERAEKLLEKVKTEIQHEQIACETHLSVRDLPAGENLARIAMTRSIDEIYIGVKNRSKVGKLIHGSTAHYLILNSPCPVVTVR